MRIATMIVLALALYTTAARAQQDAVRVTTIEVASDQLKKAIEKQQKAQALMTAGHLLVQEETKKTTDFQRDFNKYLETFHDVLSIAAEVYGIYYEVTQTSKVISEIEDILKESPENGLAVAFSAKKSKVYTDLVKCGIDIIADIRQACFSNMKMTEKERLKLMKNIRPKLRKMNQQLRKVALALRYTTFLDVWHELAGTAYRIKPEKKSDIIKQCRRDWIEVSKTVK